MNAELLGKLNRFFLDPEWKYVEDMLREYIEPLRLITNIDTKQPSEAVHAQVKANLEAYKALEGFLESVHIIQRASENTKASFK